MRPEGEVEGSADGGVCAASGLPPKMAPPGWKNGARRRFPLWVGISARHTEIVEKPPKFYDLEARNVLAVAWPRITSPPASILCFSAVGVSTCR